MNIIPHEAWGRKEEKGKGRKGKES
jgi:hypothetical protein